MQRRFAYLARDCRRLSAYRTCPHLDRARPLFGVSERFESAASQEMPRAAPHRRPTPTALFSLLHLAMQEETMQDDKDRFSRAAAITAALTLSCTIGVLYLPLFLR